MMKSVTLSAQWFLEVYSNRGQESLSEELQTYNLLLGLLVASGAGQLAGNPASGPTVSPQ